MLKPRNTLVVVTEIKDAERKTETGIVLPSVTSHEYKVCEVIAVGPGMVTEQGEMSSCRDLKEGMTVLVKLAQSRRVSQDMAQLQPIGVKFTAQDGRALSLVEQSQVVAILQPDLTAGLIN